MHGPGITLAGLFLHSSGLPTVPRSLCLFLAGLRPLWFYLVHAGIWGSFTVATRTG